MGNCLQRPKSDKQEIRDTLLRDKDDVGMITFYETEIEEKVASVYDSIMDLDGTYKLDD